MTGYVVVTKFFNDRLTSLGNIQKATALTKQANGS